MTHQLKLYGFWRSSATWRVRIALNYKQLEYTYVPVNITADAEEQKSDDYRARNPMAQVPTLELDGKTQLTQSLAIIDYLEQLAPAPALYPADPLLRARAITFAEIINSGVQPMQNLPVLREVAKMGGDGPAFARQFMVHGLTALEAAAKPYAGKFLVGDDVSVADLCLVPQMATSRRFGVDLTNMPTLVAVDQRCAELAAFIAAHADKQVDAPK